MSRRPAMLGSVIREIIAPILRTCPKECGIVSITEVRVSPDFSYADISISALSNPEAAIEYLKGEKHQLQKMLSALHRKRIPMLRFTIDPRSERGARIEKLLE